MTKKAGALGKTSTFFFCCVGCGCDYFTPTLEKRSVRGCVVFLTCEQCGQIHSVVFRPLKGNGVELMPLD